MVSEQLCGIGMNSSSKTLVLIVAGATTLAATLGVTLGTIATRSVGTQDAAGTPQPTLTLSQTQQPVVSAIAADRPETPQTTDSSVASVTPHSQVATPKTLQPEVCTRANMAIIADPNPPLNVRSSPRVASNNIVGQLQNGTRVSVVGEQNGWFLS